MRTWARWVSLVLVTSACKDDAVEPAPGVDATELASKAADDVGPGGGETKEGGRGLGLIEVRRKKPPSEGHPGGLAGITREVIDEAKRTESEPLRLVPDAAHFLIRARPAALLAHAELEALWTKTETADASMKGAMDVVRACMERLETIDDVVLGLDDEGNGVLAAHGKGLGTEATWRCFQTEASARGRAFDITITATARGEGPQLRESTGDLGYFPNDDTVVLVSKEWDAAVLERLRGAGTPATEGSLAGVFGRIRRDDALWVAGRVTGKSKSELSSTPMAGIEDVTFDLRMEGSDLVLATTADAGEAADASRMRDELQRQFDQFESMLPMLGLPTTVGPKIEFATEGDLVSLGFTLTEAELRGLRETLGRM